jgi:hypothetical protein
MPFNGYNPFFPFAFTFAHLAFVPAMMAAFPAALNRRLPFFAGLVLDFAFP